MTTSSELWISCLFLYCLSFVDFLKILEIYIRQFVFVFFIFFLFNDKLPQISFIHKRFELIFRCFPNDFCFKYLLQIENRNRFTSCFHQIILLTFENKINEFEEILNKTMIFLILITNAQTLQDICFLLSWSSSRRTKIPLSFWSTWCRKRHICKNAS